jgi:hypothetical protein
MFQFKKFLNGIKEFCNKNVVNLSLKLLVSFNIDLILIGRWLLRVARQQCINEDPTLPEDHIRREAGKTFVYRVQDPDIKIQLLLGGEKTVNEALRQALELQAILVATRPHKNNTKTYCGNRSPPTRRRDAKQSGCWSCREPGHFESNCPYDRKADNERRRKHEDSPRRDKRESPRRSGWRPSNNEETKRRGGQPLGNERGPAEKGGRRRMH